MGIQNDSEIFASIKKGSLSNVYLLFGKEIYFISACVNAIIEKTVPLASQGFNLVKFSGEKLDLSLVEEALEAAPMFAPMRCIIIKDLDLEKLVKADVDKLIALISDVNETSRFILYTTSLQYDIKKSAKTKKIFDAVSKAGNCCEFAFKDKSALKRALCEKAKKSGLAMEMDTADSLIERCSQSYAVLLNEMEKLIAYVTGDKRNEILAEDVDKCCIASIDSTAFDLAKALLQKNKNKAYKLLDELFFQRMEALSILGALNMCFLDMYRAKVALSSKKSVDDVMTDFAYPKNRAFAVKNAFRDVSAFSLKDIHNCIDELILADVTLKSSKIEDRLVLETMLAKIS